MNVGVPTVLGLVANFATAIGVLLLAWQVWETRATVRAQTRANELQIFSDLSLEFLNVISQFGERINAPNVKEADLTEQERRAIDRWFYLANMEYIVFTNELLSDGMASQMRRGIESAAKRPIFKERWRTTASNFTLDPGFRDMFEKAGRAG